MSGGITLALYIFLFTDENVFNEATPGNAVD